MRAPGLALLKAIKETLFPSLCFGCEHLLSVNQRYFCDHCAARRKPIVTRHMSLGKGSCMVVHAVGVYDQPLKPLVTKKFSGSLKAAHVMGQIMADYVQISDLSYDVIVPIPLHWTRYARRGYNQAVVAGREIARRSNKPLRILLARNKKTAFQFGLSSLERQKNLAHAFISSWWYAPRMREYLEGKHILLVDDLCTTGATLTQAAKVLQAYKPASIKALVCCRAV